MYDQPIWTEIKVIHESYGGKTCEETVQVLCIVFAPLNYVKRMSYIDLQKSPKELSD